VDLDNYVHLIERAERALVLARGAGDAWTRVALEDIAKAYGRLAREAKERAKKGQAAASLGFRVPSAVGTITGFDAGGAA
jgi:hypothetical protein